MPAIALGGRMSPIMLESLADLAQSLEAGGFDEDQRIAAIVTIARTTKGWVIQELAHRTRNKRPSESSFDRDASRA